MTTCWRWKDMSAAQRAAAQAAMLTVTATGLPPSGPESVWWALVEVETSPDHVRLEWRWKGAIFPTDVGVRIGRRGRAVRKAAR